VRRVKVSDWLLTRGTICNRIAWNENKRQSKWFWRSSLDYGSAYSILMNEVEKKLYKKPAGGIHLTLGGARATQQSSIKNLIIFYIIFYK